MSELRAAAALMNSGFYVFRSLTPQCPCDLVAVACTATSTILRVEVKSFSSDLVADRVDFDAYNSSNYDLLAIVSPARVRFVADNGATWAVRNDSSVGEVT